MNKEEFLRLLTESVEPAECKLERSAKAIFEVYTALRKAGFTEEQAFKLLGTNMQNTGGNK